MTLQLSNISWLDNYTYYNNYNPNNKRYNFQLSAWFRFQKFLFAFELFPEKGIGHPPYYSCGECHYFQGFTRRGVDKYICIQYNSNSSIWTKLPPGTLGVKQPHLLDSYSRSNTPCNYIQKFNAKYFVKVGSPEDFPSVYLYCCKCQS